jgi:hypothetical protein
VYPISLVGHRDVALSAETVAFTPRSRTHQPCAAEHVQDSLSLL